MQKNGIDTTVNRYVFIDMLRIIACFMVIVNHTNSTIFGNATPAERDWWLSLTWFFMSKPAVVIFVLISGFTLVDKQDSYRKILSRIWRMLVVLVCFSAIYYVNQYVCGEREDFGLLDFVKTIYYSNISNAYWYIYFYIGMLVVLPFVQKFVTALNRTDILVFVGLALMISSIWPVFTHYASEFGNELYLELGFFNSYVSFLLMGYYFKEYVKRKKCYAVMAAVTFVVCLTFNVLMTRVEYSINGPQNYLFLDDRLHIPVVMMAFSLFYLLQYWNYSGRLSGVLSVVGQCTFGIYLLSDLLIEKMGPLLGVLWLALRRQMPMMILYEILIFLVGVVIIYLLRLIPGVKKYV